MAKLNVNDIVDTIVVACHAATVRGERLSGEQMHEAVLDRYPETPDELFAEAAPLAIDKLRQKGRELYEHADELRAIEEECKTIARETGLAWFPKTPINKFLDPAIGLGNERAARFLTALQQ